MLADEDHRKTLTAKAAEAYRHLLTSTDSSSSEVDKSVFGIVLGAPWKDVQDIRDCENDAWMKGDTTPFCTDPSASGKPGEAWISAQSSTAKYLTPLG